MRWFTPILAGDMRKWFRALSVGSIVNVEAFETSFLAKWGDKKNLLQLLTQYNNMKRSPDETVHEFSTRFMKVYNAIPDEVNPPPPPKDVVGKGADPRFNSKSTPTSPNY
jgi:hypothetical protein